MGYGYYKRNRFDSHIPMERGYGIDCNCHKYNCQEPIDRGLAYLCYNCGWYFCPIHLTSSFCTTHDDSRDVECFAGASNQVCGRCDIDLEKWENKYPCEVDHK